MHPASEQHIPEGLLAANVLLAENSRQGFGAGTHTLHQGFGVVISHTSLGISSTLYDGRTGCRYTGKERDQESGLDYFGARYMSSNMGRFMSPDWDDDPVAIPYSDNPVSNVDADGHDVTLCANGSSQCTTVSDEQWAATRKQIAAGNSGGVTTDGKGFEGTGTILCGGSACGTATYSEKGLQDASGPMLMGIAGGMAAEYVVGRAIGAVAGWLGRGAGEAAGSAAGNAAVDVTNLSAKIVKQMGTRGWTKEEISATVQNGTAHAVTNKATGGAATEFVSPATGKFVVVDNSTRQVLQVSGPGFSPNHLMNP
jgi:RHS repeat-associated protein